jgi:replication-associated recombination protein RarA
MVEQEYLPKGIKNRAYYRPTDRGFENEIRKRLTRQKDRRTPT